MAKEKKEKPGMAEEKEDIATKTDIYKQQEKTIYTLMDVFSKQAAQPVYVSPQQPPAKQVPNYLLYIGIGLVLFLFKDKIF